MTSQLIARTEASPPQQGAPSWASRERSLRLWTGLALFAYAACHFVNHAFGILLVEGMEAASRVLLGPWKTLPGQIVLYGSFLIHGALGLKALWRRRHLRIPAVEAWQLGLGLLIPFLLIPHAVNVRLGDLLYGVEDSYPRLITHFWLTSPEDLPSQLVLLLVVWIHGCIGLHLWLRPRPRYPRWLPSLAAMATLVPVLALVGIANAGWDVEDRAQAEPGFLALHGEATPGSSQAAGMGTLAQLGLGLTIGYAGLVGGMLAGRLGRDWHARRFRGVRIAYPSGREIVAPRGFSVLEASRWAGIPHASVCGGRGRCSTCRVRISRGLEHLPPPTGLERTTLERVGAPPGVRLACQLRPTGDLTVTPLLRTEAAAPRPRATMSEGGGREVIVTALFADLRDSTRLVADRLPYDALFIVDSYVQAVTDAVVLQGGEVTSVAGDGVMAMFGLDGDAAGGARASLRAADAMWSSIDALNQDLEHELSEPLRFGVGIHAGRSVVGLLGAHGHRSVQFLGDAGNVASRLEALTKERGCTVIASQEVTVLAEAPSDHLASEEVTVRGRPAPLQVLIVHHRHQLAGLLRAGELGSTV